MRKALIIVMFCMSPFLSIGQHAFSHLKSLNLPVDNCGELKNVRIHYDPAIAKLVNKKFRDLSAEHPLHSKGLEQGKITLAMEIKLDRNSTKAYYLVFDQGGSCDPSFSFYDIKDKRYLRLGYGLEIFIPGNNKLYTSGHINSSFNVRRKYQFDGQNLVELKPSFYYVGLSSKTLNPLTLYSDKELSTELASLPANYDVEVLLAESPIANRFLIKTAFGLLGWVEVGFEPFKAIDIEGIYYVGD